MPEELKLKDIIQGEDEIPDNLHTFFIHLIGGPNPCRNTSIRKKRRIRSTNEDVIFATTSGQKIQAKYLQIGHAMKSLTGSKKVIEILNRLGHSVGYNTIEEVETELTLTFDGTKEKRLTPDGMILDPELGTFLSFDNFRPVFRKLEW